MTDLPIQEWQFENEKVTLKNVYPSAILTIEKKGRNLKKYVTKSTIYNVEKNGDITYTTKETEFFAVLAIRGNVSLLQRIIAEGRIKHPGASVFEILKMHYDRRAQTVRLSQAG